MKTTLPTAINSIDEAKAFLSELYKNNESYHPEDNAHSMVWSTVDPTFKERTQLNKLMDDIYNLPGNESHSKLIFDPCEFLLKLDPDYSED